MDGDPDPGEVVWAWVPFEEDPTLGKDRPVVVIGRHGDQLSGVALTSKQHRDTIEVGTGPWDAKGRPSYAKVDRLLDIDPATVRREGACSAAAGSTPSSKPSASSTTSPACAVMPGAAGLTAARAQRARAPVRDAASTVRQWCADHRRAVLLGMTATPVRDAPR